MSTIKVVSMTGAEVGTVELNDAIFGVEPNMSVVHEVVKNHLANCRQGTQSALTKGEVSYTTRKPWRQKGTGGPGQMGGETVTIQNLEVVKVDPELNMLVVRGAIPGPKFSLVTVKNTVKTHKVKQAGAGISSNPQKASGRNPQKASARTK